MLSDFTDDRDVLTRSSRRLPIGEASELAALADTGDDNGEDTQAAFVADETEFKSSTPTRNWRRSSRRRRCWPRFPEKKALVYFSGGVSRSRPG